jgi:hypothetical protein
LACQLLGPRDSWVLDGRCQGLEHAALAPLCRAYEVEQLEEEENDGITPRGEAKHWQVWHLNLKRL